MPQSRLIRGAAAAACAGALTLAAAGPAAARVVEVGQTPTAAVPTCPSNPCLAVSRTTGFQAKVGSSRAYYYVPADGKIVAWTVRLGALNTRQIKFFESRFGRSQAGITILRRSARLFGRVVASSPIVMLTPYFGQTVQFPLDRSLTAKKGDLIAFTVPTWAPALSTLAGDGSAWRAARGLKACDDTDTQTAQLWLGALTQYRCLYKARLTYSATLITTPTPNKTTTPTKTTTK